MRITINCAYGNEHYNSVNNRTAADREKTAKFGGIEAEQSDTRL